MNRVREIFDAAAGLPPAERAALLDRACAADVVLRTQVERLLLAHDEAGEFIEQPALALFDKSAADQPTTELTGEMSGQRIGPYRILRELGRGGMGVVYLAVRDDGEFRKQVAIKLLPVSADVDEIHRFRRERQILADLDHPNIARLMDGGTLNGRPYVVMEFVEGRSLREILREQITLPLQQVRVIAEQICAGLEAAHRLGVVHRDIKPENLIIAERDGEWRAKILDFGIAKLQQADTTTMKTYTGAIIGTVSYMSPEQAAGAGGQQIDARSDLYSIGIVLYEMLTGQPAFTGDSYLSVLYKHQHVRPVPPHELPSGSNVPVAVSQVILKALAKDRAARQQSAKQLAEELEEAFRHNIAPAKTPHGLSKTLLLTITITAIAVIFAVWGMVSRWPRPAMLPIVSPTSPTVTVATSEPVHIQYRVIKKGDGGKETPLPGNTVHPDDQIYFEITLPFSGNCYLFYEDRDGTMIWANPSLHPPPQYARANQQLRVPGNDWIRFGKEKLRKQSFVAAYVPDDLLWSLEDAVPAADWDDVTNFGPIRARYTARILNLFDTKARQVLFANPTSEGIYIAPFTDTKPRQIIFHRIILWHAK